MFTDRGVTGNNWSALTGVTHGLGGEKGQPHLFCLYEQQHLSQSNLVAREDFVQLFSVSEQPALNELQKCLRQRLGRRMLKVVSFYFRCWKSHKMKHKLLMGCNGVCVLANISIC